MSMKELRYAERVNRIIIAPLVSRSSDELQFYRYYTNATKISATIRPKAYSATSSSV
jgi:hypothetical protein